MDGEQLPPDDLADLVQQAATIDAPSSGAPGAPPGAPVEDPAAREARELRGALTLARVLVGPMFRWWPDFGSVWSDHTLQGISDSGAAVLVLNGWTMSDVFEKWGPYIGLALATAPPCVATYQAIQAHKAHLQQQQARQAAQPAERPGGSSGDPQ